MAGAAALPASLLAPASALAQEDDETDALEQVVELELASELAYSLAVEDAELAPDVKSAFEAFGEHNSDHATALSEALDQLGVDPPDVESDPNDYDRLADFDPKAAEPKLLEFMIALEQELVKVYEDVTPELEAEDLVRSAAQIGACHAQQYVALSILAGDQVPAPADI
jgi:rubrerythrin